MGVAFLLGAYLAFVILFAIGVCWLWPDFVDSSEPPRIRAALYLILAFTTGIEVTIWSFGVVQWWLLILILLANGWGLLDAFLRFPVVHDIDSLFGLKQFLLITVKLTGYALGFKDVGQYVGWFVLCILCCVFTVPILWLTALPIGDSNTYSKSDAVDVDLAVRLWRVVTHPGERALAAAHCRVLSRRAVVGLAQAAPFLAPIILRADPSLARVLRQAPAV